MYRVVGVKMTFTAKAHCYPCLAEAIIGVVKISISPGNGLRSHS
jgi:hypothetical protein